MLVTAIMAAYNAEAYIGESIESVLYQSRPPDEFIVVEDGSSDNTRKVIDRYGHRVKLISRAANRGQMSALNEGIGLARGDALAFNDADDLWCREKLDKQVRALETARDVDAVFGFVRQFVSPDVPEHRRSSIYPRHDVLPGEVAPSMLVRRASMETIGFFNERFPATGFLDWLGRAKQSGLRTLMLDEVLVLRRLHLANAGRINAKTHDMERLAALKQLIESKREKGQR